MSTAAYRRDLIDEFRRLRERVRQVELRAFGGGGGFATFDPSLARTITGAWVFNPATGLLTVADGAAVEFAAGGPRLGAASAAHAAAFGGGAPGTTGDTLELDANLMLRKVASAADPPIIALLGANGGWIGPSIDVAAATPARDLVLAAKLDWPGGGSTTEDFLYVSHGGALAPVFGVGLNQPRDFGTADNGLARLSVMPPLDAFDNAAEPTMYALLLRGATGQTSPVFGVRERFSGVDNLAVALNGAITQKTPAAGTYVERSFIHGEANPLFRRWSDGHMEWGPGGGAAPDLELYRAAVGLLRIGQSLDIVGALTLGTPLASAYIADLAIATAKLADGAVTLLKVNSALKPSGSAAATDESLRRLGTGSTHAAAGDDSRFPTAGQKNALAGADGTPGTGNEYLTKNSLGSRAQAYGAALEAIKALTPAANKLAYFNGASSAALADLTAAGRAILDDADATAQRVTLGIPTITRGTSFPASPVDGDIHFYPADTTNGINWQFIYRAGGSTYKWEFVGGSALFAEVTTGETTASTTYAALATAGPSIALPLAGDYDVEIGAELYNGAASQVATMSYDIGGTGAVDADGLRGYADAGANVIEGGNRLRRKAGLGAVTLTAKYKTSAGTMNARSRWMKVQPVRTAG